MMTLKSLSEISKRFWKIEPIVKKAIFYSFATAFIYAVYILIISFENNLLIEETRAMHFFVLAISMGIFLFLRDKFQRLLDRFFFRESYNASEVINGFEEYMAGVYQSDELKTRVIQFLNSIFHFTTFMYLARDGDHRYKADLSYGLDIVSAKFKFSAEAESRMFRSRIFMFSDMKGIPMLTQLFQWELAIPTNAQNHQKGIMFIGRKRSEKRYTYHEVQLLITLANRIASLFHISELYQKELDRKLLLERERMRIAKDFHDDVGASLTRISILSQMIDSNYFDPEKTRQWLRLIKDTCRDASHGITSIIWALNDKDDSTQSMLAYIRRFALEFLEETEIHCEINLPEKIPEVSIKAEIRRNIYLCLRETLNNMIKYSQASHVGIALDLADDMLVLTITDNGIGFNPKEVDQEKNGLLNMRKRMNDIGGRFILETREGNGTLVCFNIPLSVV